jgi:hypothetical protein
MKGKKIMILAGIVMATMIATSFAPMFSATSNEKNVSETKMVYKEIKAIHKSLPTVGTTGNILISSDNPDADDMHPKITRKGSTLVVAYEKEISSMEQGIQVVYSQDNGNTWDAAFLFNSAEFPSGSGLLQSPDIKYSPTADEFFLAMADPMAEMYNMEHAWIPGDIATATDAAWWGVSGTGASDYEECAAGVVAEWFIYLAIAETSGISRGLELLYSYHDKETDEIYQPGDLHSGWIAGFYYDAQSVTKTAPAYKPEMATGTTKICFVIEHYNEETKKYEIIYKSTVASVDPLLTTQGGGPGGMDKYADVEVWPWQGIIAEGTDPDVSASDKIVVVYMNNDNIYGDWNIICAVTTPTQPEYQPYEWQFTTVGKPLMDEKYPAVWVSGNKISIAYVRDGNLYLVESEDGGATFGEEKKINDVDGTVAMEPGTVDMNDLGIVWTDTRNGKKDIYFAPKPAAIITVDSVSGGFGIKATVSNAGTIPAENVAWSIDLEGGLIILGKHAEGTIPTLAPGASTTISSGFVLGFGKTTIKVNAGGAGKTASGFVLGPFVLGVS